MGAKRLKIPEIPEKGLQNPQINSVGSWNKRKSLLFIMFLYLEVLHKTKSGSITEKNVFCDVYCVNTDFFYNYLITRTKN